MFGKKSSRSKDQGVESFLEELPITINIGTVAAASRKDVLSYARGIADAQLIAKESAFIDAFPANGQWVYEIHEGGAGVALGPWIVEQLDHTRKGSDISLPLAGQRVAQVSTFEGELATIIFPPDEERFDYTLREIERKSAGNSWKKLKPYLNDGSRIRQVGKYVALASLCLFLLSASAFFARMNLSDTSSLLAQKAVHQEGFITPAQNLPSFQMDKAMSSIIASNGYLSYLKLENGKWIHAQATGDAPPITTR